MNKKSFLEDDLLSLSILSDDAIDLTEDPELLDFSSSIEGAFYSMEERDYDVRAIANWCLDRARDENLVPTNMWLNKIVYFIYEAAIQKFDVLLTPARVEAWDHGPVFREIYFAGKSDSVQKFKSFNPKSRKMEEAVESFREDDLEIFVRIWNHYAHLSGSQLRNISHSRNSPWSAVWSYRGKTNPGMQISVSTILGCIRPDDAWTKSKRK